MEREKFLSSIYLIIKNDNGEVLLQRRQGTKLWSGYPVIPTILILNRCISTILKYFFYLALIKPLCCTCKSYKAFIASTAFKSSLGIM